VLRTPEQLKDVSDEQVVSLWDDADALILAAVFGEESGRIRRLVRDQGPGADVPIMAMNSKRGITRLSPARRRARHGLALGQGSQRDGRQPGAR